MQLRRATVTTFVSKTPTRDLPSTVRSTHCQPTLALYSRKRARHAQSETLPQQLCAARTYM